MNPAMPRDTRPSACNSAMRLVGLVATVYVLSATAALGELLVGGPVVVLLGAPGSGRSTQAAEVAKYLKAPIVSAADLVRENAVELKNARRPGITGIEPETDPLLNKFFEARLRRGDVRNGLILDGYPNTKDHADFASRLVASGAMSKPIILHLQVPDHVVRKRLAGKNGKLSASVEQMLKDYHRETTALKIYFPDAEIADIDGTKKPKAVTKKIKALMKARFRKQ